MSDHKLHYPVSVVTLPGRGFRIVLEPDEAERAELARLAGIVSVNRFRAELLFKRWHKNGVAVTGEVQAQITQECAVTLEPLTNTVQEAVERWFVPDGSKLTRPQLNEEGEWVLDPDGPDIPDPFTGDTLDAWEIVLEHFLLGIDPFARKEGAELSLAPTGQDAAEEEGDGRQTPFAGLKDLLKGRE